MTLSRQLMFSGMIILLCLFVGMITYVVKNTQSFLNQQLASHSQDSATALGLSLSVTMKENDLVTAGRMVDAIWDRGYYKSIEVDAPNGAPIIERRLQVKMYDVPEWFINLIKLNTEQREAIIMDGWKKVGVVRIQSNPGFAYQQIWFTFIDSLYWFLFTSLIAMMLGAMLLYIILRPLRAITEQAIAICNQQFPIQHNLPWTIDLRQVVEAMNNMSRRLKMLFEEQSRATENFREQAFKDPVTHLGNRRFFDLQLDYLLKDKEKGTAGVLLFIELEQFKEYNDQFGYEAGDHLLQNVANILSKETAEIMDAIVAHIKGADFAILLPNKTRSFAEEIASQICVAFSELQAKGLAKVQAIGHIGITAFSVGDDKKEVFSKADMALRGAQNQGQNQWAWLDPNQSQVHGAREWADIFSKVISTKRILLHFQEIQLWDNSTKKNFEAYMRLKLDNDDIVSAGVFMPMAEQLNQMIALDKLAIEDVCQKIKDRGAEFQFFVNISPSVLVDAEFQKWILEQIKALKHKSSFVLELPEYGVVNRIDQAREFFHKFTALGAKTSIDHYGTNFSSFSYLYNLKINYLKIGGSFVKDIQANVENQAFVKSLVDIAHSLDILVIAEAIETQAQYATLKSLKVDGAQGYFIAKPSDLNI